MSGTLTSKNFDRIWLEPREGADPYIGRQWCQDNQWGEAGVEYVRADLVPAPVEHALIKTLEWLEGAPGTYTEVAESPFGHYSVWEIDGTACWAPWKAGSGSIAEGGIAGAKAAAQADFEARIRTALVAPEDTTHA